jgi:hypothetical protein
MNEGSLTLRRVSFMVWPGEAANTEHIQVKDFTTEDRHRQLIHWAGLCWGKTLEQMSRPDILLHFEKSITAACLSGLGFGDGVAHNFGFNVRSSLP